ncbi:MAG: ATP-binding domain-containing protein, partial [Actinomycetia bacterium]|nr:ATP-binding domain-containing protein [Actinomycetes bacterium]
TMHSAKGLEFDCVYIIHAADGNIPSDMATGSTEEIEEERRLFYVACTRAKEYLYVTHPLRYYVSGHGTSDRYGYALRTRFIPEEVRPLFAEVQTGAREAAGPAPFAMSSAATSIRASMRAMWE